MLRSRLIPFLLMENGKLIKTTKFASPKYVGDPLNTIRIFNEKEVDELFIADRGASRMGVGPDFNLLASLAAQSRMPVTYAGGVSRAEDFERLVSVGIEKVAVSSSYLADSRAVRVACNAVGSQSVAVVIDVKRSSDDARELLVYERNNPSVGLLNAVELARRAQDDGVGEVIVNSVDRDGTMEGFDLDLAQRIRESVDIPMTIVGGAASRADLAQLSSLFGPVGIGVGSFFVFTGKFKSVLVQYPSIEVKREICGGSR